MGTQVICDHTEGGSADIITAIVEGRQPTSLTARTLHDIDLPLAWADQRALLGFA
ncbi:hypothetical protein [Novosphingobium sp.]|uniref:hypothetical protein n=1 Tax=Novosphingobium sp. TaxID=1874826 RepID=UPI00286DE776|nr:hypothetical protein [Novosphingobium sp.]